MRNPVDTGRPLETFGQVLALVSGDEVVDALLVYALEESDAVDPEAALRTPGVAGHLPIVFGAGGPREALDLRQKALATMGMPLYRTPERAARAMRALVEDARAQARRTVAAASGSVTVPSLPSDQPLDEHQTKLVLESMGVATPTRRACSTRAEAHTALEDLGAPVVVKVLDASVAHKAAVGGVVVGVTDTASMDAALQAVGRVGDRFLVEAQAAPGPELLVGGFRDACFGPVVVLGRGGSDVEAFGPPALRLAPMSDADLAELVAQVDPGLDGAALAPVVRAVEALLAVPDVAEVDVNPVRLTPSGPVALDVLVVRGSHGEG
jgi:acetyltransferase